MDNSFDFLNRKSHRIRRIKDAAKHKPKNLMQSDSDDLRLSLNNTPLTKTPEETEKETILEGYRDGYSRALLQTLKDHDLKLNTEHLGQHFLIDQKILKIIVQAARIENGDSILEIGAGPGNLTQEIWKACAEVKACLAAIELDERFRPILDKIVEGSNINLIWGEAIQEFGKIVEQYGINKVVANIPYQILEPLLIAIHTNRRIKRVVLMVGERYAERACVGLKGPRGQEAFSKTSLFSQARFTPEIIIKVSREKFIPQPKTESAVLVLNERGKKNRNSVFETATRYITMRPNLLVKHFLQESIGGFSSKRRARNQRDIEAMTHTPSIKDLGLPANVLNAPISRLTNPDLQLLLSKLDLLRKKQRSR